MGRHWGAVSVKLGRSRAARFVTVLTLGLWALVAMALCAACKEAPKQTEPSLRVIPLPMPDVSALSTEMGMSPEVLAAGFNIVSNLSPLNQTILQRVGVLPAERVRLGHQLFFDPRLSSSGHISCQSCHVLSKYGVDGKSKAIGHAGHVGRRNTSSVYNLAAVDLFFWDGRAHSLEEQARGPLLNAQEMALSDGSAAVAILKAIPGYRSAFQRAFPKESDPITFDNALTAIATYERQLVTPAPIDRYVAGDPSAISKDAFRGLAVFVNRGCGSCHGGNTFGGSGLERLGARVPWPNQEDQGLAATTGNDGDKMIFKVQSLRNVEKTAPYFHDGSAETLEEAVLLMAKHQLALELSPRDLASLVAFLRTLTGELPEAWIAEPTLPD
jgi:cytochrome c peroxidase